MNEILKIDNLHVSFDTYAGEVHAVRGVSMSVEEGEILAVVGESGCGKSVTAQTIMKLNPMPPARIKEGNISLCGEDIVAASEKRMQEIRGKMVSMIFQDPMTCLNPTMKIGTQIVEAIKKHKKLDSAECKREAIRLLNMVQIPNAEKRADQFPHEFSGGMRQRAMIAMALSCSPKLIIADEPTTALDVTIQAQIMQLMGNLSKETKTAIILITHDLGVVANLAKRVCVMYAGKVVESGSVQDIFYRPGHPYTLCLLKSLPTIHTQKGSKLTSIPGTPPDLYAPPKGCEFASRCPYAMKLCLEKVPPQYELNHKNESSHLATCFRHHPDYPNSQTEGGAA